MTENGTDKQCNFFSYNPTGSGIGIGGPHPIPLPAGYLPADGIYDPSNASSDLAKLMGANSTNPADYDAILKIADGVSGLVLKGIQVAQGYQDSLNINNAVSGCNISGAFSISANKGLRSITVKGGSCNNFISGTVYHQQNVTLKLGDWSDQNTSFSIGNDFVGLSLQGGAITVAAGEAKSNLFPASADYEKLYSFFLDVYWSVKFDVRSVMKIKVPNSGPWFLP